MDQLAVITPSFAGDAELFADLHQSVLENTAETTVHHVIVPSADHALFSRYAGARCRVWTERELLPHRYVRLDRPAVWINGRRPWPPVRGWVVQQALKIAVAGLVDADAVLVADSDVVLVRSTDTERFMIDGLLALYRTDDAVHAGMTRHVRWHQVARRLLALPATDSLPLHDYVSSLNPWDPALVRAMQHRISEVTGRSWLDAVTSQLHVSEFILYGVFVEELVGATQRRPLLGPSFCHNYWDTTPLGHDDALAFIDRMPSDAIGMMISSKSRTSKEVRRAAMRRLGETDRTR